MTKITFMKPLQLGLGLIALAALTACSLVPTYERPEAPVALSWPQQGDTADQAQELLPAAELPWQDFIQNESLRQLVARGLENNRDLQIAIENIEVARAQYQIRRADQYPTLGLSADGQRSRPNPSAALGGGSVAANYSVGLGTGAWELDFFGRIAALKDAALAQYLATEEARKAAQISLISSISSVWLQLKTDTELLGLANRTLATREQSLRLVKLRFESGASSALDLKQAETLIGSARATQARQKRLRAEDINLLTLLVGEKLPAELIPQVPTAPAISQPNDLDVTLPEPVPELPRFLDVPAGLPSDLLLRRPDIRAAEQQLIAANANIGAARANFFPRISLTTSLGRVSSDLDGLLGSGGQRAWLLGAGLDLPLFDMGRRQAGLEAAEAQRNIVVAQYEQSIQSAFQEVADALAGRATYGEELQALQDQAQAERERYRLADLRYRNGIATQLDMLDAQRSLFAVEQQLAQVQLAQRANEVELYKALGGGWISLPADQNDASAQQVQPDDLPTP